MIPQRKAPSVLYRLVFVAFLLILFPLQAHAQDAEPPVITGQVSNGTPGGTVPDDLSLNAQFFSEGAWTSVYTTTLSADGTFRFDKFEEISGDFFVSVLYQGVEYYSEPLSIEDGDEIVADIRIFETTDDISNVVIDQAHFFMVPGGDVIRIAEYYLIGNRGDRTYIGQMNDTDVYTTLALSLPAGATELSFDGPGFDERFTGDANLFADTRPIPPGEATIEIGFSYALPYQSGMVITRSVDVPVSSVALVASGSELGLTGEGLVSAGVMETQMGPATSYSAGPLAAGEPLVFSVEQQTGHADGLPPAPSVPSAPGERNTSREIGISLAVLALAGFMSYLIWQSTTVPPMPESARPLVMKIIELEDQYEAGEVEESVYLEQREKLVGRIRKIR